jgi:hypothetical protein
MQTDMSKEACAKHRVPLPRHWPRELLLSLFISACRSRLRLNSTAPSTAQWATLLLSLLQLNVREASVCRLHRTAHTCNKNHRHGGRQKVMLLARREVHVIFVAFVLWASCAGALSIQVRVLLDST